MKKHLICASLMVLTSMSSYAALFHPTVNRSADFPNTSSSYLKQPKKAVYADLVKVTMGNDKNTIRAALGDPHFHEFGSSTWNYWLAVHDDSTNTFKECQLKVDFKGDHNTVNGIKWNTDDCQTLATTKPVNVIEKVVVKEVHTPAPTLPVQAPVKYSIATDGLFEFDTAKLITQDRKYQKLHSVIDMINNNSDKIYKVVITGNTDRLGSNEYNQSLGYQRATAVRNLITIPSNKIVVQNNGENNPVTQCSDNLPRKQLIDCLADDRRVDIEVTSFR